MPPVNDRRERHLVLGAGPVGMAVAQSLGAAGLPYDQVDAAEGVGGNWRHGVYRTAHIISSRRVTQYSHFPMPEHYPDFPSRDQMLAYLESFADHFDLHQHLELSRKVVYIRPVEESLWQVSFEDGEERLYKGVLLCNGHHWCRRWPEFEGTFDGELIHSKDYKDPEELKDRRVLVIGGGNSACDVAAEAARVGRSCDLSLRSGVWFLPKTFFGVPLTELILPWMPVPMQRLALRAALRLVVGPYERYGLPRPDHRIFERHPTINTEVLHHLRHGRIQPRPAIHRLDGDGVLFQDGERGVYDLIVAATGYHVAYPFLPPELERVKGAVVQCYGGTMLPDYKGLYFVGWGQPRYGFGALVVPGSRMLARLLALQEEIHRPLGSVFEALGDRPPETHLSDPHDSLRRLRRANRFFPLLRWRARRLDRGWEGFENPVLPAPDAERLERPLAVA